MKCLPYHYHPKHCILLSFYYVENHELFRLKFKWYLGIDVIQLWMWKVSLASGLLQGLVDPQL